VKPKVRKSKPEQRSPRVDEDIRPLHEAIQDMLKMPPKEIFAIAVRAGIYTEDGQLTPPYRDDAPPSACRPTR
jgi:hypothetical protein